MAELSPNHLARLKSVHASDECHEELDDLIEGLLCFDDEGPEDIAPGSLLITSSIVASESGDRFLRTTVGVETSRDIALSEFASNPSWWCSFDSLNIDEHEYTVITPEEIAEAIKK